MIILGEDLVTVKISKMTEENEETSQARKRILTTIGNKKCPWGCIYCFVDSENYPGLNRIDRPDAENVYHLTDKSVDIIQPAADVEITLVPDYTDLLNKLADFGKHISFSTKSRIRNLKLDELRIIHEKLSAKGAILQIAVSILKLNDWHEIEQRTPSPFERIETLKLLYETGIATSVAFRPLLPFITRGEIEEIVELTHRYTYAYLTGPVYLTPALIKYMTEKGHKYILDKKQVNWIPNNPIMDVVQSPELEKILIDCAEKYKVPVFKSNIDLVAALAQKFVNP